MRAARRDLWLNAALAVQVVLTLVLTGQLWLFPFGRQVVPTERAKVTQVPPGGFVSVPALVRPIRFIAHWADGKHAAVQAGTFQYDWLWEELRVLLASGAVLRTGEWQADKGTGVAALWGKTAAVDVELAGPLTIGEWVQQWGGGLGDPAHEHTEVDRILVVLGPASALYYFGPSGIWRGPGLTPAQQEGIQGWLQRADRTQLTPYRLLKAPEGMESAPGIFVPAQSPQLGSIRLQANTVQPRDLETGLFPDLSVVREIAEGNGAIMYTDGQKYLRLNPGGTIEYRAPELSARARAPALGQALNLAAQFVAEHGGWPEGLVLTGVSPSGGQTALEFSRSAGAWPVVSNEPLLRVEVSSDRVVYFYRVAAYSGVLPKSAAEGAQAIDPESALAAWRAGPARRPGLSLRSVYFAYAYRKGTITPVWCLQLAGIPPAMVDARTGNPVP